jgi:hypothetical protein
VKKVLRKLLFIFAPLLILAGAWIIFFAWAIANMVDPDLAPPIRRKAVLDNVLSGLPIIALGAGLILLGFFSQFARVRLW